MADLFRFFRESKTKVKISEKATNNNENLRSRSDSSINNNDERDQRSSCSPTYLHQFNIQSCIHVTNEKWEDIWNGYLKQYSLHCDGLVFINPNFARMFYIPSSSFRYNFQLFNEYPRQTCWANEMIWKQEQVDEWMRSNIQSTSCYISMHCCQVTEILDRFCLHCPNLIRISFHYYHLDNNTIDYLVQHFPYLLSINLENSIGLSVDSMSKLGRLSNLLHLNLSGCDLYDQSLMALFENCPRLESLDISNNCSITGQYFNCGTFRQLKRLNIKDCWRLTPERLIQMAKFGLPNLLELICNSGINDKSLTVICFNCLNLIHLDISFEEFTYSDRSGNCLTENGFKSISRLTKLNILCLRHVGRLTNEALNKITESCQLLTELVLNLRHRHKLTDDKALQNITKRCPNLIHFESVHNHFIGKQSLQNLSNSFLQLLILRGNELIMDEDAAKLIETCNNLRIINLDGCSNISHSTLASCIFRAKAIRKNKSTNVTPEFWASLILTSIERTFINSLLKTFPENLRIRASDYQTNKVHYNEFDGKNVYEYDLRERFYPYYWQDFN